MAIGDVTLLDNDDLAKQLLSTAEWVQTSYAPRPEVVANIVAELREAARRLAPETYERAEKSRKPHLVEVLRDARDITGGFRAFCNTCTWRGILRTAKTSAELDANDHSLQVWLSRYNLEPETTKLHIGGTITKSHEVILEDGSRVTVVDGFELEEISLVGAQRIDPRTDASR